MLRFARDPSGGWRYHLRARRGRHRWAPFRRELADFLGPWLEIQQEAGRPMVLVGPSGGYTLPWSQLSQFADKIAVEPDPVARRILLRKDPSLLLDPNPALGWTRRGYCAERLVAWFDQYRGCAFLFCNLLGQLDDLHRPQTPLWRRTFLDELRRRDWSSYHDLVSAACPPDLACLRALIPRAASLCPIQETELWQEVYRGAKGSLHLVDHGTAGLFAGARAALSQRTYLSWPLIPGRWHLIEGLASATDGRGRDKQLNPTN